MKVKILSTPYTDKYNFTFQVGEVVCKMLDVVDVQFVDGRRNTFILGKDCRVVDEHLEPLGVWGYCKNNEIEDKIGELLEKLYNITP